MSSLLSVECGRRVLCIEVTALSALADRLDESFASAVDLFFACQGKVVVTRIGKSGLVGAKVAATLASTGTPAFFLHAADGAHGDLGMVARNDAVLAISYSGETEEVLRLLPLLKRLGLSIVSMVGKPHSSLARHSDIVLDVSVKEEACTLGLAPTASTTVCMALGDALAIALLEKRDFKQEDFALYHPGGSLGRRLLLRVEDLMHTGQDIPRVQETALIKDALLEMTSKKLGITTVENAHGELVGILTDGDLRRLLNRGVDLFMTEVGKIMTRSPKTITRDKLAAEAISVMEHYKITSLVVTCDDNRIEGIIHLHDLLQAGLA